MVIVKAAALILGGLACARSAACADVGAKNGLGWGLFRRDFSRCQFEERYLPTVDADAALGAESYQRVASQEANFGLAFR